MALDPLQEQITQTALSLPQAHTLALAGGGAMIAHGLVDRATHDVDLFTEIDPDEAVQVAEALRGALTAAGLKITQAARPPHANRFIAHDPRTG
ncbi:nucleotidyl transferase AbiEii/AbiGii toxin family protein [Cryptosporangium aurantiacum]|uniref:Nucleotidyl transferase AbiEii toxin, Type IV TA system n=1 Tax=Cryptosporangium aurantiacum TaxID=134849 RepID=A0A1M7RKS5_9ACTN|nr:nucleotidyl transferase AbiEii/AbiGii toxin family protein [Cryptosporangium aurantiacum]SHN46907.1 Nucleotidyl transferase AbiEii toxin, Type IV TA system [Cryptosporangium aurantiacum]